MLSLSWPTLRCSLDLEVFKKILHRKSNYSTIGLWHDPVSLLSSPTPPQANSFENSKTRPPQKTSSDNRTRCFSPNQLRLNTAPEPAESFSTRWLRSRAALPAMPLNQNRLFFPPLTNLGPAWLSRDQRSSPQSRSAFVLPDHLPPCCREENYLSTVASAAGPGRTTDTPLPGAKGLSSQ